MWRGIPEALGRPESVLSSLHLEDSCLRGEPLVAQLRRPRTCEAVVVSVLALGGLASCQPLGVLEPQQMRRMSQIP